MSLKDPNVAHPGRRKRVAIVIANPAVSSTTGWPVGFWWSELTHPYLVFEEAGYETVVFSPDGGRCEADGMSDPNDASGYSKTDLITQGLDSVIRGTLHALVLAADATPAGQWSDSALWASCSPPPVAGGRYPIREAPHHVLQSCC